jgi:hypothetical protein
VLADTNTVTVSDHGIGYYSSDATGWWITQGVLVLVVVLIVVGLVILWRRRAARRA